MLVAERGPFKYSNLFPLSLFHPSFLPQVTFNHEHTVRDLIRFAESAAGPGSSGSSWQAGFPPRKLHGLIKEDGTWPTIQQAGLLNCVVREVVARETGGKGAGTEAGKESAKRK